MTIKQIILWASAYLIEFVAVIYFTRATLRRVVGAAIGGTVARQWRIAGIYLCEAVGWWHIPFASTPYFLPLFFIGLVISLTPIYLVTWRLARRFGWRGLAIFAGIVTIIGAPRDFLIATIFPKWMVFAPGIAPLLADAATYLGIVLLGHALMSLVAGPSGKDRLARQQVRNS